ncbi:hypothetical protein GCK32_020848, partial [Trichostrongylus colubriformis]
CSCLFSPPQVVRLLSDVSFKAVSGEVHALVGTDEITGERFKKLCSFLSGRQWCPGFMTVHSFLYYTAALTFENFLPRKEIDKRVHMLLRQFDLLGYGHEKLHDLSYSAQRRALIANALIKDPRE